MNDIINNENETNVAPRYNLAAIDLTIEDAPVEAPRYNFAGLDLNDERANEDFNAILELPETAPADEAEVIEIGAPATVQIDLIPAPVPASSGVFGTIPATTKVEEALAFGGLDYEVETFRIKPVLTGIADEPEAEWVVPSFTGIRRADDRKTVFAVMRETYTPVQNRQILEYVTPLLEATAGEFTRVGSFNNGAQVFAFITLNERLVLPGGKEVQQHLLLNSSHDGSKCLEIKIAATIDGDLLKMSKGYAFRHTKLVHIRTKEVVRILEMKDTFNKELIEKIGKLANETMTNDEASNWLKNFLDYPSQPDVTVHFMKVAAHDRIMDAFRKAIAGGNTRLAMALAVSYDRSRTVPVMKTKNFISAEESRANSTMNGTSARELEEAWKALLA
jgi:Domain of unknown function (DUF932)